jgi:hypothetical protein
MATAEQIEHRLRTGERMIEAATDPEERDRLETFWINLLRQYERMVDAERERRERGVAA